MLVPFAELQIIGLALDVLGAFVIVIPDIPYLREYHRAGRLRSGLNRLETLSLSRHETGYSDVTNLIHSIEPPEDSDFDRPPEVLATRRENLAKGSMNKVYGFYSVEGNDEMVAERYSNTAYSGLRMRIQQEIGQSESKVRAYGFILLAGGFMIQIFSLL